MKWLDSDSHEAHGLIKGFVVKQSDWRQNDWRTNVSCMTTFIHEFVRQATLAVQQPEISPLYQALSVQSQPTTCVL